MKGVYLKKGNTKVTVVPYYRVGDLFLTTIATNPSNFLGGTWELFGPGKCLVCVDTSQTEFNSVKKTGGEKTHKLTINEMPSHNHPGAYWAQKEGYGHLNVGSTSNANRVDISGITFAGGDQAHNNLQPYITCYIWIRTA